ncbi:MAG: hypothetical protein GY830_00930 [Bacteroidetes bacterium]|nr:hypothetical protein [Bacteroidota bacterium]
MENINNKRVQILLSLSLAFFILNSLSIQINAAETSFFEDLSHLRVNVVIKEKKSIQYLPKKVYKVDMECDCTKKLNYILGISLDDFIVKFQEPFSFLSLDKFNTKSNDTIEENIEKDNHDKEIQFDKLEIPKTITLYTILCYFGSSKNKFNKEIKKIYKIFQNNLKSIDLDRDYSDIYYIASIGKFFSKSEAESFKHSIRQFRKYRIKKIELSNNYDEIIKILKKNIKD